MRGMKTTSCCVWAFGLEIPAKIYTNGDIRELKSSVNPF